MGMENAYPIGKDISNVHFFYHQGIRYKIITHTQNNELGDSSTYQKQKWNGLSYHGKKVIKEINILGIMVDIYHGWHKWWLTSIMVEIIYGWNQLWLTSIMVGINYG